ncbi:branched-chain alpha-keto acid dehydrogenase subunit E2 [Streptomyces canus]|uniref:Dihydrolipoamide acetyltransferase component of pyruvate dehydrogenase complex n=1 Tax=Streptomyces canus TaxID=58343 RepID=A0A101RMJ8_9ACTN|nr:MULTISPECIES: dihydrolipoamide acetyltransferase family protein [Streptomyces]KUN58400.1 branched-chain alpha-keto acid dehydrogenase subunit E2 [Streptomyces canus]MDI5907106.1 dihydrolipoamide acetyltransferase family protein [Streptomyces sp. 12257]
MASVREFALPDLGEGLPSAEIVRWLVTVGDVIGVDQPVAEVETAKAVVEVPCPYPGVVTTLAGPHGTVVPVGAPLITVAVSEAPSAAPAPTQDNGGGSGNVLVGYGTSPQPTRLRRPRAVLPPPDPDAVPAEPTRRQTVAVVSPLVRRLAREHGVALDRLTGSGPAGLILRRDVEQVITAGSGGAQDSVVVPLSVVGRRAAEAFMRSRREVPDASCWVDVDAAALLSAKDSLNTGDAQHRIGLLALLARICVAALARVPELNSDVVTDTQGRATGVRRHAAVHLGFAAQTPRGLVVPVVHDAQARTTAELASEIDRLTEAARAGTLTPAELTGGTFTLNNYGIFGVDGATPIIYHPEAAMVGVGRIARKPWVVGEEVTARPVMQLSLTFDHRVCDGATASAFLRFVADAVEDPTALLRHL